MFGWGKGAVHKEINALELSEMLKAGTATLVDVREPGEFAQAHIAGAINLPLSSFDPADVPIQVGKTVVLQCAGGKRSATALDRCKTAKAAIDTHLAGGIGVWMAHGLPVVRG